MLKVSNRSYPCSKVPTTDLGGGVSVQPFVPVSQLKNWDEASLDLGQ